MDALELEKALRRAIEGALNVVGAKGAEKMKSFLQEGSGADTDRLRGSISWATSKVKAIPSEPNVRDEDLIAQPVDGPGNVKLDIGTACYYAKYVNYGALPHGQGDKTGMAASAQDGTFMEKMREWATHQGWWDDTPEAESRLYAIAQAIRDEGTDAIPFFEPSFGSIEMMLRKGMNDFGARFGQEYNPNSVTIVMSDGRTKNTKAHAAFRA